MAPVYLTICGIKPGEGLVLARNRQGANMVEEIESFVTERLNGKDSSLVVQTNMDTLKCDQNDRKDDWQDICFSRRRRAFATTALASVNGKVTMNDLWLLVSCPPCLAWDTVYTTSMVPKTGEIVTRVEATQIQRTEGQKKYENVVIGEFGLLFVDY